MLIYSFVNTRWHVRSDAVHPLLTLANCKAKSWATAVNGNWNLIFEKYVSYIANTNKRLAEFLDILDLHVVLKDQTAAIWNLEPGIVVKLQLGYRLGPTTR